MTEWPNLLASRPADPRHGLSLRERLRAWARFHFNRLRVWAARKLLPDVEGVHYCDGEQHAFPYACPGCGAVRCQMYGADDDYGDVCDSCFARLEEVLGGAIGRVVTKKPKRRRRARPAPGRA